MRFFRTLTGSNQTIRVIYVFNGVFLHAYRFKDGYLNPGDVAGLGVDIDKKKPKNIPVNRHGFRSIAKKTELCSIGEIFLLFLNT